MSVAKAHDGGADAACGRVAEALPFLLNDTLDDGERRDVLDHIVACQTCQADLEDTAYAWVSAGSHPPGQVLADYGLGLDLEGFPRDLLERHLSTCSVCSAALEPLLGGSERAVDGEFDALEGHQSVEAASGAVPSESTETATNPPTRDSSKEPAWRQLAAAASFLTVLLSAALLWQLYGREFPEQGGNVQIVELHPMEARYRGGETVSGPALDPEQSLALVLVPAETPTSSTLRVRLLDESGETLRQFDALTLSATGDVAILLPQRTPGASLQLVLEEPSASSGETAGEWRTLGRYTMPGAP